MALFPPETSVPCHSCGTAVELAKTQCPDCSANLLVIVCPECESIMQRNEGQCGKCGKCGKILPDAYRMLGDIEIRELFLVELSLSFNRTSDQVAPDQRKNFIELWSAYKRRLLNEITPAEFSAAQADAARNMISARAASQSKTGCATSIFITVGTLISTWALARLAVS